MRTWIVVAALAALASCRGEPVPRDYQNAPPAVTHPPQTESQTPSAHGGGDAPPQPTTGVEGTAGPYEPATETQTVGGTLPDTPPTTT